MQRTFLGVTLPPIRNSGEGASQGLSYTEDGMKTTRVRSPSRNWRRIQDFIPLLLLALLVGIVGIAGGSVRADALGAPIVRTTALLLASAAILWGPVPAPRRIIGPLAMVMAFVLILLIQILPIPGSWWFALPGHGQYDAIAEILPELHGWRPISLVPDATLNALFAMIVPLSALLLLSMVSTNRVTLVFHMLLGFAIVSALIGSLQLSGGLMPNPFINDTPGEVGGLLANRNHHALLLAAGIVLTAHWYINGAARTISRLTIAALLASWLLLILLATGSRAGLALGLVAIVGAIALAWRGIGPALSASPRWMRIAIAAGAAIIPIALLAASFMQDRARSLDRAIELDAGSDMRLRALPTVLQMVRDFFPLGAGFGSFDTVFRSYEPAELLSIRYFNHAHNDFLELVFEGGLPALLLLIVSVAWYAHRSLRVWRKPPSQIVMAGRTASLVVFMIGIASIVDYPLRTPSMTVLLCVCGVALSLACSRVAPSVGTLPDDTSAL